MKTMTVIKVSAAGNPSQIVAKKVLDMEEGKALETYYNEIDCALIDHVVVDYELGIDMIVDDEGKLASKPLNLIATCLAQTRIYGDVLLVSFRDNNKMDADGKPVFDGDWHSLDKKQMPWICNLVTLAFATMVKATIQDIMKGF